MRLLYKLYSAEMKNFCEQTLWKLNYNSRSIYNVFQHLPWFYWRNFYAFNLQQTLR